MSSNDIVATKERRRMDPDQIRDLDDFDLLRLIDYLQGDLVEVTNQIRNYDERGQGPDDEGWIYRVRDAKSHIDAKLLIALKEMAERRKDDLFIVDKWASFKSFHDTSKMLLDPLRYEQIIAAMEDGSEFREYLNG